MIKEQNYQNFTKNLKKENKKIKLIQTIKK